MSDIVYYILLILIGVAIGFGFRKLVFRKKLPDNNTLSYSIGFLFSYLFLLFVFNEFLFSSKLVVDLDLETLNFEELGDSIIYLIYNFVFAGTLIIGITSVLFLRFVMKRSVNIFYQLIVYFIPLLIFLIIFYLF